MFFLYFFLGAACLWDYAFRRIPNILQLSAWSIGLLWAFKTGSYGGAFEYLLTFAFVTLIFSVFFRLGMIGGGDVKLIAVCSAYFGKEGAIYFILFTMLFAGFIGIVEMIGRKQLRERIRFFAGYVGKVTASLKGERDRAGLYLRRRDEKIKCSVVMSGPALLSAILHYGGVY